MLEAGPDQDYEDPDNYSLGPAPKTRTRGVSEAIEPLTVTVPKAEHPSDY